MGGQRQKLAREGRGRGDLELRAHLTFFVSLHFLLSGFSFFSSTRSILFHYRGSSKVKTLIRVICCKINLQTKAEHWA